MSEAKKFVDSFENAANMIWKHAPKNLTFWIIIYARDTNVKTDTFPDWDIYFKTVERMNHYDRATLWQYIKEDVL